MRLDETASHSRTPSQTAYQKAEIGDVRFNEAHLGQALLGLVAIGGFNSPIQAGASTIDIERLIARQREDPSIGDRELFITEASARLLQSVLSAAPPRASSEFLPWSSSSVVTRARATLIAADLAWVIQLFAIDLWHRGLSPATPWTDSNGRTVSLTALFDAETLYAELNTRLSGLNYVTEYGVHILAMHDLIAALFKGESSLVVTPEAERRIAELRRDLQGLLYQSDGSTSRTIVAAHLIGISRCDAARGVSPPIPLQALDALEDEVVGSLVVQDRPTTTILTHAILGLEAVGLQNIDQRERSDAMSQYLSICATV